MAAQEYEGKAKRQRDEGKAANWAALIVALAILAPAGLGIWYWQDYMLSDGDLTRPNQTVRHDPEQLAPGLDAYAARNHSPNHHRIVTRVKVGDIQPWLAHLDNIAAHRGWYTTFHGRISRNLILPGGHIEALWDAKREPYAWLERNRPPPDAEAKPLELGKYPAYVTLRVEQHTPVWSIFLIIGCLMAIVLGLLIGACVFMNAIEEDRR